jgi:hypothetical protein
MSLPIPNPNEQAGSITPARYYVYIIYDPRDGKPFYVGKGVGAARPCSPACL